MADTELRLVERAVMDMVLSREGKRRYGNGDPLTLDPSDLRDIVRLTMEKCAALASRPADPSLQPVHQRENAESLQRAEVDDEGLPPLPSPEFCAGDLEIGEPVYTAEQYRQGQRDAVAADRARREKLPANAEEMVAFIGSHYNNMRDNKPDPNDIAYELTVHDLLSAFRWWFDEFELEDEPSHTTNKENG